MAQRSVKQLIAAGAAALLLGGAAFGAVSAQQAPPTPTTQTAASRQRGPEGQQQFLEALAVKLGISTETLQQAIEEVRQEQGLPPGGGPGFGGHGPGHHRGHGPHLDIAAQAIGITPQQLREELPGSTLTAVAEAHNVDPQAVADALEADAVARIDQAVENGRMTDEQADEKKAQIETRIDELMNQTFDESGADRPGMPGGPHSGGRPNLAPAGA